MGAVIILGGIFMFLFFVIFFSIVCDDWKDVIATIFTFVLLSLIAIGIANAISAVVY